MLPNFRWSFLPWLALALGRAGAGLVVDQREHEVERYIPVCRCRRSACLHGVLPKNVSDIGI